MSFLPVLRPLLCAALLCAGVPALAAGGAVLARAAGASADAAPTPPAAAASGAGPAGPALVGAGAGTGAGAGYAARADAGAGADAGREAAPPAAPTIEIGIPDLRQRIGERLAAMRAARAAARRVAAASAAAAEPAAAPTVAPALHAPAASGARASGARSSEPAPEAASSPRRTAPGPAAEAVARRPAARPPSVATAAHGERSWSYAGETGPEAWAALRPDYATCAAGQRQSPIDIRDGISVDLEPLRFDYRPGAFSVLDTGHTVQVDVAPGNTLAVGGRRYELRQFHFHRPSEERIEGRGYEMDVHLVHADPEGRLAVVTVLVEGGKAHPLVQQVWNNLPLEAGQPQAAPGPIDPAALLPEDRRYATFMGSLTTPPCTEGVLWIVLKQPATMSPEQIAIFARLYPMNARPLQAAAGRLVKQSN